MFLVGCGFQSTAMNMIDAGKQSGPDASIDTGTTPPPPDAMIDGQVCFGAGLVKVCLDSPPANPVMYSGASSIDTTTAGNCTKTIPVSGGPELCVIAGTSVTVNGTLTATGSRALVLISATSLSVPGTLDVSSAISVNPRRGAGANSGACANPGNPENDGGGAGGGAGGSFATKGGNGGTGDLNQNGNPPGTASGGNAGNAQNKPTILRGGCRGGDGGTADGQHRGRGGDGGGAVYLIAVTSISITGDVFASGAGGSTDAGGNGAEEGGGGGGTGGMIGLDAPALTISGRVAANGGGGGGGGGTVGGTPGGDGSTTNWNAQAASGGGGGGGGDGARGTTFNATNNIDGASSDGGAGGGGGGIGVVWIDGTVTDGSKISPAPTAH